MARDRRSCRGLEPEVGVEWQRRGVRCHHLQIGEARTVRAAPGADALGQPPRQTTAARRRRHQHVEQADMVAVDHAQREGDGLTLVFDLREADRRRDRAQHLGHRLAMHWRHRTQGGEACQPGVGGRRHDTDFGVEDEPVVEDRPLDQALVDPAVAGASQQLVRAGRGEGRQPPDRRQAGRPVRSFEAVLHLMCQSGIRLQGIDRIGSFRVAAGQALDPAVVGPGLQGRPGAEGADFERPDIDGG